MAAIATGFSRGSLRRKVREKGQDGYGHADKLSQGEIEDGRTDGRDHAACKVARGHEKDATNAGELFNDLCEGWKPRFFHAIKPSVDAGVNANEGKGKGNNLKEPNGSLVLKKINTDGLSHDIGQKGT